MNFSTKTVSKDVQLCQNAYWKKKRKNVIYGIEYIKKIKVITSSNTSNGQTSFVIISYFVYLCSLGAQWLVEQIWWCHSNIFLIHQGDLDALHSATRFPDSRRNNRELHHTDPESGVALQVNYIPAIGNEMKTWIKESRLWKKSFKFYTKERIKK